MNIVEDVTRQRKQIVTDAITVTWRELISQYKDGDLRIDPEYQRLFRWDLDQQTQFIESLLLGIPSPAVFLAENQDGRFEMLDGLQRISTLLKFFAAEVFEGELLSNHDDESSANDIRVQTTLAKGPLLPSLSGYTAQTLPEALVRTIKYARVTQIQLKRESDSSARMEVFRRLNRFGSQLSDQEIRNATARLHGKSFPDALRRAAEEAQVRDALALSELDERRMAVEEFLLRALALISALDSFDHSMVEFLDSFMISATEGKVQIDSHKLDRLRSSFALIAQQIPDGRAFRFSRGGFSSGLFDVVISGVYENLDALNSAPERFLELHQKLLSDPGSGLREVVGGGANSKRKVLGRVQLGRNWFGRTD